MFSHLCLTHLIDRWDLKISCGGHLVRSACLSSRATPYWKSTRGDQWVRDFCDLRRSYSPISRRSTRKWRRGVASAGRLTRGLGNACGEYADVRLDDGERTHGDLPNKVRGVLAGRVSVASARTYAWEAVSTSFLLGQTSRSPFNSPRYHKNSTTPFKRPKTRRRREHMAASCLQGSAVRSDVFSGSGSVVSKVSTSFALAPRRALTSEVV